MQDIQQLGGSGTVAIVGAGLVGAGWAVVYARAGLKVKVFDANPEITRKSIPLIAGQLAGLHRHRLIEHDPAIILSRITTASTLAEAVEGVAYVQESVLERVDVKRQLMIDLDAIASPDLIVGSSTSGIPGSAFALGLSISPRILIVHPVNPPYLVPVVELVSPVVELVETFCAITRSYAAVVATATARQLNCSSTRRRPAAPIRARRSGSSSRSRSLRTSSPTSPGVNRSAHSPSGPTTSGIAPVRLATSGVSHAISSAVGSEKPS